jgi:hypothetical protein
MGKARFFSIATAAVVVLNLGVVAASGADAAQGGGNDLCVAVSGGTVLNETVLDVVADGGTGIGDASGGNGNLALTANGGNETATDNGNGNGNGNGNNNDDNGNGNNNNGNGNNNRDDNGNGNGNNNRRDDNGNGNGNGNRNDWSAESLDVLEQRLLQTDTASSGNGGVADAAANGGAVSIQDINSGGNVGNAISIGDTVCAGAEKAPTGGGGGYKPAGNAGGGNAGGGGGRGGQVRALPSTGVGELGRASGSLILALGALGMMGLSVGSRLDRRIGQIGGR